MTFFRKLLAFAVLCAATIVLGTAAYSVLYEDPDPLPRAAAIVVLSGPGADIPVPEGETLERVRRGVELWKAGAAPIVVMFGSGGTMKEHGHADSAGMAELARRLGVPADAILEEARSYSTLQNAWFTAALPEIDPTAPIIVVTHRYHLPRAWASFRWAGFTDLTLVAADHDAGHIRAGTLSEAVKWPLNLARAVGARAALSAGLSEDTVLPWLH
jgi:uncharacterized SAM-binding protein YcdF (DUF218 family)